MTMRMGAKGQVVIPKDIRDKVGLHPGTEVDVAAQGREVIVTAHRPRAVLGGRFRASDMARRLLEDRATEKR
jgi:AbrB family looped-hinge helix DNA binding protein